MNLAPIDWLIVAAVLAVMFVGVAISQRHMRSVADFLAANRTVGRYVLSISMSLAWLGAISIIGNFEMNFVAGFSLAWWGFTMGLVILVVTLSGWVIYRFRQTRALTLAEFLERRYSRHFRIFAGLVAWLSGIVNFGIFPAVGARFFIYFCGLPHSFSVLGLEIATFPVTMIALLGLALYFVFSGGQVAVIVTDFIQGVFVNFSFIALVLYLLLVVVKWDQIAAALATAPTDASLINPFKTSHVKDFNFWYFLIGVIGFIHGTMSWQGTQAYNSCAKSAHEAKMGAALSNWRNVPQNLMMMIVPIIGFTILRHADFQHIADNVNNILASVSSETLQNQLRIPIVLTQILPKGLMGAFTAVMLAAFITTHDTYLHSWGSIFVQDVFIPLRGRPLSKRAHLLALRLSIVGVAVFIFCFSLLFQQNQHINLFFAVTGAIFAGGAGTIIIGGLYWKYGTTPAAWSAMITGSSIAVGGVILHQIYDDFPINGQMFWGLAIFGSVLVFVLVSLLGRRQVHDLDKLLNRGRYARAGETVTANDVPVRGWRLISRKLLGMGKEFTRGDKLIYIGTTAHMLFWLLIFIVGTVYNLTHEVDDDAWMKFWQFFVYWHVVVAVLVMVWFSIGGFRDVREMLHRLRTMQRDDDDDGTVAGGAPASAHSTERDG